MNQFTIGAVIALVSLFAAPAVACPACRPLVNAGIWNADFWGTAGMLSLPFLAVSVFAWWMGRGESP